MRLRTASLSTSLILLLGGCGSDSPLRPTRTLLRDDSPKAVAVELDVELSSQDGSPASPISVKAIARNLGTARVYSALLPTSAPCACDGFDIQVLGPDGVRLALVDSCAPQPVCLCALLTIQPGTHHDRSLAFGGRPYRMVKSEWPYECAQEDAPSGEYTAVVRYGYFTDATYAPTILEKRVTFRWTGPS